MVAYHLPPTFAIICHDGNKAAAYIDGARQNLTKDQYLKPGFFLKAEEGEDNYRGIDPKHAPNYLWVMDRDGNILFERQNQQHWEVLPYAEAKYLTEEQRVSMREHRTFIHRQHRVPQHGDLVAAMELVGPGTRGGVYRGIGRGGGSLGWELTIRQEEGENRCGQQVVIRSAAHSLGLRCAVHVHE